MKIWFIVLFFTWLYRTLITETSKKISLTGKNLRDIQMMAGHSSLQTTQRYV